MGTKESRRFSENPQDSYGKALIGAEATAIVYTLPEAVKANNLRLEGYIEYLLDLLPERLTVDPDADIDGLLPWADGVQKKFAMIGTRA